MRVLDARFYPRRRGQPDFEMVGYLACRREQHGERPVFEPVRAMVPDAIVSKSHYFVAGDELG